MSNGNVYTPRRLQSDRFHDDLLARFKIELRDARTACATDDDRRELDAAYDILRQQWMLLRSIHARRFIPDSELAHPAWQQFNGPAAQVIGLVRAWQSITPLMDRFLVHPASVEFSGIVRSSYASLMKDLILKNVVLFDRHRRTAPQIPPIDPLQAVLEEHFKEEDYHAIEADWQAMPEYRFDDTTPISQTLPVALPAARNASSSLQMAIPYNAPTWQKTLVQARIDLESARPKFAALFGRDDFDLVLLRSHGGDVGNVSNLRSRKN